MPSVSLWSANLGIVAKACSRQPSYLYNLQFEVLAGKLQFWKRMRTCVLVKIPAAWKGEGMLPSDLKQFSSKIYQHRTHWKVLLKCSLLLLLYCGKKNLLNNLQIPFICTCTFSMFQRKVRQKYNSGEKHYAE